MMRVGQSRSRSKPWRYVMSDAGEKREELEELAKERVEELPGETALGHRDPQAGGEGEPEDYKGNSDVKLP
jgi:hypothetical protein